MGRFGPVTESQKSEIRKYEIDQAIRQICEALKIEPSSLTEGQRYGLLEAIFEYAAQTRKNWDTRRSDKWAGEHDAEFYEAFILSSKERQMQKLRRLIAHPTTLETEREAARGLLIRLQRTGDGNGKTV